MVYTVEMNEDPFRHAMADTASVTKCVDQTSDASKSRKICCQILGVMIGIIIVAVVTSLSVFYSNHGKEVTTETPTKTPGTSTVRLLPSSPGIWILTDTDMYCRDKIEASIKDNLVACQPHCEGVGANRVTFFPSNSNFCRCCTASSGLYPYSLGKVYTLTETRTAIPTTTPVPVSEFVVLEKNELCNEQNVIDDENECTLAAYRPATTMSSTWRHQQRILKDVT